jgi:urease accessory protein
MLRAIAAAAAGAWPANEARDSAYDERFRRRIKLVTDAGAELLLDLPKAVALGDGDGLKLEGGGWIGVRAAAEPLVELTGEPSLLLRLAWHLGNRHTPAQLLPGALRIRPDHVLVEMARGLGANAREVAAPFQPESGAYAQGHVHAHGHDHDR